jgi:membrane protein YqaA with SNARE-associated domain
MIFDPAFFSALVHAFGYLGVFLSALIGSASIILPVPSFIFVVAAGSVLNPLAVGIIAGAGAALGELIGYFLGVGIRLGKKKLAKNKKEGRWEKTIKSWFSRKLGFFVIVVFAATPLPDDIVGIFCGFAKYDIKKYFIAVLIGKLILCLALAYSGYFGWEFLSEHLA